LIDFLTAEWHILSLPVLFCIFGVIILCYLASRHLGSVEKRRYTAINGLEMNDLGENPLELTTLESPLPDPTIVRVKTGLEMWGRLATRAYVALALACAFLFLGRTLLLLQCPGWYPATLVGFPFVSTFFVERVWNKIDE